MDISQSNLLSEYYSFYDVKDRNEFLNKLADERNLGLSLTELSIWRRFNQRRFEFSDKEGELDEFYDRYFGFLLEQIFSLNLIGKFNKINSANINNKFVLFFSNEVNKVLCLVADDLELDINSLGSKTYNQALSSLKPGIELIMTYELIHAAKKYLFISESDMEKEFRFKKLGSLTETWWSTNMIKDSISIFFNNWQDFMQESKKGDLNFVLK